MKTEQTFIFAAGGTGGHLYPAIALAQKVRKGKPKSRIHFIGTRRGLESQVIPKLEFPISYISVRGFVRAWTLRNFLVPVQLLWSLCQCYALYRKLQPTAVIGTGGYVSGPALFVAVLCHYPTLIQEQNSYPGVTTRLLARWVDRVHLSFEQSKHFLKRQDNVSVTGNPVRDFNTRITKAKARKHFHLSPQRPTLFVFGGSQGAVMINRAIIACLKLLMKKTSVQIIWCAGKTGLDEVESAVQPYSARIRPFAFLMEMDIAYAASDVIVSRAGAITLAEIAIFGLPAILIPYPYAAANHQEVNARTMEKHGAATVILEKDVTSDTLSDAIRKLLTNTSMRRKMSQAAKLAAYPKATDTIVRSLFKII